MEAFYEEWEHACCGQPFRVGDEVAWELALMDLDTDRRTTWRDHLTELTPDELPALRRTAVERESVSPPKGARLYGMVQVCWHGAIGGEPERVTARIGAIHTVALRRREDPPGLRSFAPVPGQLWLHAVEDSAARDISPDVPRGGRYGLDGWLITLESVALGWPQRRGRRRR
ncbi:DUF6578 domain-containing protein [Streptomyces sp. NPDC002851]